MLRRDFLLGAGRGAVAFALRPRLRGTRTPPQTSSAAKLAGRLEQELPRLLTETRIPGFSIAIVRDARLFWHREFGVRRAGSNERVDRHTVFQAGSVSKTVFAYAVLKLCERGILDLDTPLTRYTSERILENDPRLELITARHVLSHSSGLQNWRSEKEPLKIHFAPGEKYLYSGEGYSYLQSVVTHLTGHVDMAHCATYEAGLKVCATDFDSYMK